MINETTMKKMVKEIQAMKKDKKKPLLSKSNLILRLVAGMYLIYLAYELFTGLGKAGAEGAPPIVSIGSAIVFGICGILLVGITGKTFLKGEYEGGIMDISEKVETEDEE